MCYKDITNVFRVKWVWVAIVLSGSVILVMVVMVVVLVNQRVPLLVEGLGRAERTAEA